MIGLVTDNVEDVICVHLSFTSLNWWVMKLIDSKTIIIKMMFCV